jgi:hypothetical protein
MDSSGFGLDEGGHDSSHKASRLCAAESPNLQHDAILRLFTDAQNSPGQIAFSGPTVYERILTIAVKFAMERGKFREPFALLADFGVSGSAISTRARSSWVQSFIYKPPLV